MRGHSGDTGNVGIGPSLRERLEDGEAEEKVAIQYPTRVDGVFSKLGE